MTVLSARAEVRTAALAAELLQLGVSGGLYLGILELSSFGGLSCESKVSLFISFSFFLCDSLLVAFWETGCFHFLFASLAFVLVTKRLVGEAASAVRLGDGLLFRGSEGVSEPWLKMFPQMLECALFYHFSLFGLFYWGKGSGIGGGHVSHPLFLAAENLLAGSKLALSSHILQLNCTQLKKNFENLLFFHFFPKLFSFKKRHENQPGGFGRGVSYLNPHVLCLCGCPSLWHRELQLVQTFPVPCSLGFFGGSRGRGEGKPLEGLFDHSPTLQLFHGWKFA